MITGGEFPADVPMLPRLLLRRCHVAGQACLDIGSMEGLVPVLLRRRGADPVLAVDFSNHCLGRMAAVQHYHGVEFAFRSVGLIYDLGRRLRSGSFDLINLSGLLYHVFSPLMALAAVRPLLRRDGLLVLSTYVTLDPAPVMDFNAAGRLWSEQNTFWFPSVVLLDYLLRFLRLAPVDCAYLPADELARPELAPVRALTAADGLGKEAGYLSVACRAVDRADGDPWMEGSARTSWEYQGLFDAARADAQPRSSIGHDRDERLTLDPAVVRAHAVSRPAGPDDGHLLRLAAAS